MYKTVRHGENSLQYTILPQQDDSATAAVVVGPRHRKKGKKTAAVLALTVVLICGVIATAVLVPLLLTSDLASLPAAFQHFSVASMHTVRVGSHKEVLARKPADWRPQPHYIHVPTTTPSTTPSTTTPKTTTPSTTTTTTTTTTTQEASTVPVSTTGKPTAAAAATIESAPSALSATTATPTHNHTEQWSSSVDVVSVRTTLAVPWYHVPPLKWSLMTPVLAGAGILTLCIALITILCIRRRRTSRKRLVAQNPPQDKQNLLTDPAALSDDDQ